jgi:hypothetical protein
MYLRSYQARINLAKNEIGDLLCRFLEYFEKAEQLQLSELVNVHRVYDGKWKETHLSN